VRTGPVKPFRVVTGGKMTKLHYIIAAAISLICLSLMIASWTLPKIIIDQKILILLGIAILPWLTLFFKRLKFWQVEVETRERSQGTTSKPIPPQESSSSSAEITLSSDAKKILATLWKYQKPYFKDDKIKRWTFRVFSNSFHYTSYLSGLVELLKYGLVAINSENEQCMLTNEGISLVETDPSLQNYADIYTF